MDENLHSQTHTIKWNEWKVKWNVNQKVYIKRKNALNVKNFDFKTKKMVETKALDVTKVF